VVTLMATASNGQACTGQSAPFDVHTGATAQVGVTLVCGGGTPTQTMGQVNIGATFVEGDNCPLVTSWSVSPLQVSIAGTINVAATATDADVGVTPGEALTFAWTAAGGTFASPADARTTFTCTVSGAQTLTLTVSDNHAPKSCADHVDVNVLCVGGDTLGLCGDGVVGPAEQCDGAGTYTPNVGVCGPNCFFQHPVCGNGYLELGEQCDPPNGTTCDSTCKTIAPLNSASCAFCEINATTAGTCFNTSTTQNAGTTDYTKFGCNGFSGSARTHCFDLIACLRATHCGAGDDPTPCLCGALPAATCAATSLSALPGVCAAPYLAAGLDVFGQFFSTDSPIGVANNLYACDVDAPCSCYGGYIAPDGGAGGAGGTAPDGGAAGAGGTPDGGVAGAGSASDGGAGHPFDAGTGPDGGESCLGCDLNGTQSGACFETSPTPFAGTTDPALFGCAGFDHIAGKSSSTCYALLDCLRTSHCAIGDDPTACLCGALSAPACATTPPTQLHGACTSQYLAAAGPDDIYGIFFSTDSPVGVANDLFTCDIDAPCTCDQPLDGQGGGADGGVLPL
jgi:hypothetical protein